MTAIGGDGQDVALPGPAEEPAAPTLEALLAGPPRLGCAPSGCQVWGRTDTVGGRVAVGTGQVVHVGERTITALDVTDGTLRWFQPRQADGDGNVAGPVLLDTFGLAIADAATVRVLDPFDGRTRSETTLPGDRVERLVRHRNDLLVTTVAATGAPRHLVRVHRDGTIRWQRPVDAWLDPAGGADPLLVIHDGELLALGDRDGVPRWRQRLPEDVTDVQLVDGWLAITTATGGRLLPADGGAAIQRREGWRIRDVMGWPQGPIVLWERLDADPPSFELTIPDAVGEPSTHPVPSTDLPARPDMDAQLEVTTDWGIRVVLGGGRSVVTVDPDTGDVLAKEELAVPTASEVWRESGISFVRDDDTLAIHTDGAVLHARGATHLAAHQPLIVHGHLGVLRLDPSPRSTR